MLDDRVTGVKTAESIVKELGSSPPSRPRSTPSSTPWPDSPDSVSELEFQVGGRDTRPEKRGTGTPLSQTTWCSTSLTEGRGSSSSPDSVGASQGQVRGRDTRSEGRGTGSPSCTATWCSTSMTGRRGSPACHAQSRGNVDNHPHSFGQHLPEPADILKPRGDPDHLQHHGHGQHLDTRHLQGSQHDPAVQTGSKGPSSSPTGN